MNRGILLTVATSLVVSASAFAGEASFNEVLKVVNGPLPEELTTDAAKNDSAAYLNGGIPQYQMSVIGILKNLAQRAFHTLTDSNDYYDRLEKQIHQNGICFTGTWEITEPSQYSGYFAQGKTGLFIGRASAATNPTTAQGDRAFGFAGKLFPTTNPDEKVTTANFFTVDTLAGSHAPRFMDVGLTNEPDLPGFPKSFDDVKFGGIIVATLLKGATLAGDPKLNFRPVWPISKAGLASNEQVKTPHWIQIRGAQNMSRVNEADFRRELDLSRYPDHAIDLDILVSDTTKDTGPNSASKWTRLGRIHLVDSVVSYGCDRRLHFPHPSANQ